MQDGLVIPKEVGDACVYMAIDPHPIGIRSQPTTSYECLVPGRLVDRGELVAIDLVQHYHHCTFTQDKDLDVAKHGKVQHEHPHEHQHGPFLRLSDASGWVFEHKAGKQLMQRIPIQQGLWCFYVDHAPQGLALRHHPCDRLDLRMTHPVTGEIMVLHPMQKIYCDVKVMHPQTGVCFYRVQGTGGWVFDKRLAPKSPSSSSSSSFPLKSLQASLSSSSSSSSSSSLQQTYTVMLLPENQIQTGLFVYRALHTIGIRGLPQVSEQAKTILSVPQNAMVAIDCIRPSPYDKDKHGPFLRVAHGSGWLFCKKQGDIIMESIPIKSGLWMVRVLNDPVGLTLRKHPAENDEYLHGQVLHTHEVVRCDRKVTCPSSKVNFYRVEGTQGWIFDRRKGYPMLELVSSGPPAVCVQPDASTRGWNPEFVRGIASTVPGVTFLSHHEKSQLISFRTDCDHDVHVYYQSRKVALVSLEHAFHHGDKNQVFLPCCTDAGLREIMCDPCLHLAKASNRTLDKKSNRDCPNVEKSDEKAQEEKNKSHPFGNEKAVLPPFGLGHILHHHHQQDEEERLRNQLLQHDLQLAKLQKQRLELLAKVHPMDAARAIQAKQEKRLMNQRLRDKAEMEKKKVKCMDCGGVFADKRHLLVHRRNVHCFKCREPGKAFLNKGGLFQNWNGTICDS